MKSVDMNKDLLALNEQELKDKIVDWRRQLLSLRLNAATAHIKDHSQFKKLRRNIARGLTFIQQKSATMNKKESSNE